MEKFCKLGRFCEFNNFRAKNRFDRFARVICFKRKITLFTRVLWNGICWEKMMGMRHELHPLLSSSNFLFRPPPKHAIDKSRPKRHSNCPKCYSTFNKNWKLSARKTNKLSTRIFTHFLWILTKIQPNGTLRSTSRLFIKELENELTFDAKTFSISVTRTMDGGGENDYDYVAIGN